MRAARRRTGTELTSGRRGRQLRRLGFAAILIAVVGVLPWDAGATGDGLDDDLGTCSTSALSACMTTKAVYTGKACSSGQGQDCITCESSPGSVCTWAQGPEDLTGHRQRVVH